jgi:hypothetical protein
MQVKYKAAVPAIILSVEIQVQDVNKCYENQQKEEKKKEKQGLQDNHFRNGHSRFAKSSLN